MWTIESVKRELPNVPVSYRGKLHVGRMSGRLCEDATVTLGWCPALPSFVDIHYAWATVARALNTGKALRM